jgi:hypothetical protein
VDNSLVLSCNDIEVGIIFFDDVLGAYVAVDFFGLIISTQNLTSIGLFVGVVDRVVANAE